MCSRVLAWWRTGPVDQYLLQALQFSVPLNLLSTLLRYNGFTGIQKAVVGQMDNRAPNSDHDRFLVQVWLWEVLWSFLVPTTELVIAGCWVYKIHFSLHITIQMGNGPLLLTIRIFLTFWSAWEAPTRVFSLFQFVQILNNHRMVDWVLWQLLVLRIRFEHQLCWLLSVGHCQLGMAGHCTPHLQGSCLCKWCCKLSLLLYDPFWTRIRELLNFPFCLTSP